LEKNVWDPLTEFISNFGTNKEHEEESTSLINRMSMSMRDDHKLVYTDFDTYFNATENWEG
jgi:hypothetical protein